ncbi:hypothetical protein O9993_16930 [Vibrio lentus]|nr:hypothetical protein [Vibrio lentus]
MIAAALPVIEGRGERRTRSSLVGTRQELDRSSNFKISLAFSGKPDENDRTSEDSQKHIPVRHSALPLPQLLAASPLDDELIATPKLGRSRHTNSMK